MIQKLNKWDCIIDPIIKNNQQIGGLYLADIDCALSQELLSSLQVGALLSVIDEPKVTISPSIIHHVINIPDCTEQNIQEFFPKTNEFIERHRYSMYEYDFFHLYTPLHFHFYLKSQQTLLIKLLQHTNVMVHCFAGISRSASVVIAYIMQKFNWGFQRTLNSVIARRPQVKPNSGFVKQLIQYETQNRNRSASQQNRILNTINTVIDKMPYQSDSKNNKYFQPSKLDINQLEMEITRRQQDLQILRMKYQQLNDKIVNRNNVYVSAFE